MNRRGFFGILAGGAVAASITVKPKAKTPDPFIRWADLGLMAFGRDTRRVTWLPYGPLDYIQLNAPIKGMLVTDFGASFHCADGCLYHLNGLDPDDSLAKHKTTDACC